MKKSLLYTLSIAGILFSACSKKESAKPLPVIDADTVSLHYDQTHQYSVTNATSLTWTSSDTTVGTVNASGLFSAKKIGNTTIIATSADGNVQSKVTVKPYSTLCQEPYFIPGATMATIEGLETRALSSSSSTVLFYTGENEKIIAAGYAFHETGLTSSILLLNDNIEVIAEAVTFFKERYTYAGKDDTFSYFAGTDGIMIGLSVNSYLGFNALYLTNSDAETTSSLNLKNLRVKFDKMYKRTIAQYTSKTKN